MKKIKILALSTFLLAGGMVSLPSQQTSALSGSEFKAGRIMDDSVFFNGTTMNANDIQVFLNSKVPVCDTNGEKPYAGTTRAAYGTSKGYPPPYTCLKDYVQSTTSLSAEPGLCNGFSGGTKSAAQIINEVAVSCGINQRVLLVLLQKEQAFITDDWPWSVQYEKATGYACPDTAPCDPEYAGFFKQVYYGARQFKRYAQTPDSWRYRAGRVNSIQYHPNAGCGSSDVYIQNQATAGLYIYTPYQPNAAALNNLYGEGDSCSAYGNRNFWRMYNDWFGATLGPLVRSTTNSTLYYSDGTEKYLVPSMSLAAQYGLGLGDVRYMTQQELDAIPLTDSPNTKNLSQLVKSDSDSDADGGALYLITNGKKYQVKSMAQLSSFGFSSTQVSYMDISNLHRLPSGGWLQDFVQAPNSFIYKAEAGKKRGIFSLSTYNSLNTSGEYTRLSSYTLDTVATGSPKIIGDAIMRRSDGKIWLYQDDKWHYLSSMNIYNCWNFSSIPNYGFNSQQATAPNVSPSLGCVAQHSNGKKYILNKVNRFINNDSWGTANVSTVSDRTIDRLPLRPAFSDKTAFKASNSSSIYVLEQGKKRGILNMNNFNRLGFNSSSTATVNSGFLNSLSNGPVKVGTGTVLKKSDGNLYVVNGDGKLHIPTMSVYHAFNLGKSDNLPANQSLLDSYSDQGSLSTRFWISTIALLVDSGTRYYVPDAVKPHAGYTTPGSPLYQLWMTANTSDGKDMTRFIKADNSRTIYYLENGQKRPISSYNKFTSLGGSSSNIIVLTPQSIALFPTGPVI